MIPNKDNFKLVCTDIEMGTPLNLHHIGMIFGNDFWKLIILVQAHIDLTSKNKPIINIILPK